MVSTSIDESLSKMHNDREVERWLQKLGYDSDFVREGECRVYAGSKAEADDIRERLETTLGDMDEDAWSNHNWRLNVWSLKGTDWSDFGERRPVDKGGRERPYAVVIWCPWRPGHTEPFEFRVDRFFEGQYIEAVLIAPRTWRIRVEESTNTEKAGRQLLQRLKRAFGAYECCGLEFVLETTGATIELEIRG